MVEKYNKVSLYKEIESLNRLFLQMPYVLWLLDSVVLTHYVEQKGLLHYITLKQDTL